MFLKITTLLIAMMMYSFDGYACMFVYMPYDLKKDRDVVFTAKASVCHTVNGKGYTNLYVQKIWKGKVRPIYTFLEGCSKSAGSEGKSYMIGANYKEDKGIVEIPLNAFCTQSTMPIDPSIRTHMREMFLFFKYGGEFKHFYDFVMAGGETNWGLGKPLHDYRRFRYDEVLLNHYVSILAVLLLPLLIYFFWTCVLSRKFRIKK